MDHVVLYSGGLGSWAAAKRVAELQGTKNLKLLFTDTKTEDEDLYRFLYESAKNIGGELIKLTEGRDVWQVFFDKRYLGNSRVDPCSDILKRQMSIKWFQQNYTPENVIKYVGIDWTEEHRYKRIVERSYPWTVKAPLCEPPFLTKNDIKLWLNSEGIIHPRLYDLGFIHNNCGGFCVKAGQAHFKRLLDTMPERFQYHENKEQELRQYLGKDVTILRKQVNGVKENITLKDFRLSILQNNKDYDIEEWGGCSCFAGPEV